VWEVPGKVVSNHILFTGQILNFEVKFLQAQGPALLTWSFQIGQWIATSAPRDRCEL
jgi:hypothetical protein